MEALLRGLWPMLKPIVVARLTARLMKLAEERGVPVTEEQVLKGVAALVTWIEDLVTQDDDPELVKKAVSALAAD